MNEYHVDFQNDVKENKRNIYHPSGKKKYKMYFENLKGKERREYMEEKNLREYNIAEMNIQQFRNTYINFRPLGIVIIARGLCFLRTRGNIKKCVGNNHVINKRPVKSVQVIYKF